MIQWHLLLDQLDQSELAYETLAEDLAAAGSQMGTQLGTQRMAPASRLSARGLKALHTRLGNEAFARLLGHMPSDEVHPTKASLSDPVDESIAIPTPAVQTNDSYPPEIRASIAHMMHIFPLLPDQWLMLENYYVSAPSSHQSDLVQDLLPPLWALTDRQSQHFMQEVARLGLDRLRLMQALLRRWLADIGQYTTTAEPQTPDED